MKDSQFAGLTSVEVLTLGREKAQSIKTEIRKVVKGVEMDPLIDILVVARFVTKGHVIARAAVGVGKTITLRAYAKATRGEFSRVQCRADMLPSEITGYEMPNLKTGEIEVRDGPLFRKNVVLVDEINRATPVAQAPFLEAMEEQSLTVGKTTFKLEPDFQVLATRNPQEHEGTFDLPEAQLDRFFAQPLVEDPSEDTIMQILGDPDISEVDELLMRIDPIITPEQILIIRKAIKTIHVDQRLDRYIARLRAATWKHPLIAWGASPRGAICLKQAAKVAAFLAGPREDEEFGQGFFVTPDDVQRYAVDILAHRIFKKPERRIDSQAISTREIVQELITEGSPNEVKFD